MARQPGARTQVVFAFESVYGMPPASGYRRMPLAATTLGSEQGLLSPKLLRYGRDPQAPVSGAVNVDGDVVIPMDAENLGSWRTAIFGQPTTSATTLRTHTSGGGELRRRVCGEGKDVGLGIGYRARSAAIPTDEAI